MAPPPKPDPFPADSQREVDAGAVFVLQSKGKWSQKIYIHLEPLLWRNGEVFIFFYLHAGEWWHAGFHLTTAIVGPTILTLPYVFKGLGWALGFFCLTVMGMVTFYAYYLMSKVLDYCEKDGRRHIRFRELAADVLGNYRNGKRAAGFVLFW